VKQLPLILVLLLSSGLLLWNFRRYDVALAADSGGGPSSAVGIDTDVSSARLALGSLEPDASPGSRGANWHTPLGRADQVDGTRVALAIPVDVPESDSEILEPQEPEEQTPRAEPIVEQVVLLLPDGEVRAEGATVDGIKHGRWLEWWEADQPLSDGAYEYGQRQGPWTYWHENGEVMERGAYKDDLPDGPWTSHHANGVKMLAVSYTTGLRDGPIYEWADDGTSVRQGHFASGQPDGRWIESNPDGSPRSETHYLNGVRHGQHRAWYTDGQLREQGEYRAGLREGRWLFYDAHGRSIPLRSGYYELGYRHRP